MNTVYVMVFLAIGTDGSLTTLPVQAGDVLYPPTHSREACEANLLSVAKEDQTWKMKYRTAIDNGQLIQPLVLEQKFIDSTFYQMCLSVKPEIKGCSKPSECEGN